MAGRYNQSGRSRGNSIPILPRKDWFAMIAVALSLTLNRQTKK